MPKTFIKVVVARICWKDPEICIGIRKHVLPPGLLVPPDLFEIPKDFRRPRPLDLIEVLALTPFPLTVEQMLPPQPIPWITGKGFTPELVATLEGLAAVAAATVTLPEAMQAVVIKALEAEAARLKIPDGFELRFEPQSVERQA